MCTARISGIWPKECINKSLPILSMTSFTYMSFLRCLYANIYIIYIYIYVTIHINKYANIYIEMYTYIKKKELLIFFKTTKHLSESDFFPPSPLAQRNHFFYQLSWLVVRSQDSGMSMAAPWVGKTDP